MKIIVAGDGKVGSTLVKQLSMEDYDLTLIDTNGRTLENIANQYDVMAIQGNCAAMDVLREAGIKETDLLIATTGQDEVNLLCCITAHGMNPKLHTIARTRNPEYTDQIYKMRDQFALSLSVNPERRTATEIERLLKYPGFLRRETFANGRVEIVELRIDEKSKLCNVSMNDMYQIVKCAILVCVVLRDGKAITPNGDFVLRDGDRVFVTASVENLTLLLKNLGIITHKVKRVMLCGGSRISVYLAQKLEKSGITVQIIEQDRERCKQLARYLPDSCIIHGDASDQFLLESEGINGCDALVALTGLDELNMIIALYARYCKVPQVITKVGHMEGVILDSLPLGSIVCPKELCSNAIVRYVRAMRNQAGAARSIHRIADGHAEALEFRVDETTLHCHVPLKDLKIKKNVLIAVISRGGNQELANGNSSFQPGDTVIVVSSADTVIYKLNDIFE